jgi:hypothetical protein
VHDIYGEIDLDGTGASWEYTDMRAVRNFDVTAANTTWIESEWMLETADIADVTPGIHTPPGTATKLVISAVNSGVPVISNDAFTLSIETRDDNDILVAVDSNVTLSVSLFTGTGALTGNTTFTMNSGNETIDLTGLMYDVADANVSLIVSHEGGVLANDTTEVFEVISAPDVAEIVITEIMYNPPESGTDTLEFIELYNNGSETVDLAGYSFSFGVTYAFTTETIDAGEYMIMAANKAAADAFYGINSYDYGGSLTNSGEAIVLIDDLARIVDSVFYPDILPADGDGPSLTLCDPNLDNSIADNWEMSMNFIDSVNAKPLYATPGMGCITPEPVEFEILSVNSGVSITVDSLFSCVVVCRDENGFVAAPTSDMNYTIELVTGTGVLSGSTTGTFLTGQDTLVVSGLQYNTAEFFQFRIVDDAAVVLADTTDMIEAVTILPVPELIEVSVVNSGNPVYNNIPFSIEVTTLSALLSPMVTPFDVDFEIVLETGTGNLGGTLTGTIPIGSSSVVINGLTYDQIENGVVIRPLDLGGDPLTSKASDPFDVTAFGDSLLISEVADPSDLTTARFVEVFNGGSNAIDLGANQYYLAKQINGGATWKDMQLTGIIQPLEAFAVAGDSAAFVDTYGFQADVYADGASGNGDDAYFLYVGGDHLTGTLIDIYGEIDLDGTGTAWDYEDAHAVRNFDIFAPNTTWTQSEWTIQSGASVDMTPGQHQEPLPPFKMVITSINGGMPAYVNSDFTLDILLVDSLGNPVQAIETVPVNISVNTGTGVLTGTTNASIAIGQSTVTLSALTYDTAETGVQLQIDDAVSVSVIGDTSDIFDVLDAAPMAEIVITEIMYNPPEGGTDSLEFVEIYNPSSSESIDLTGYYFAGIDYTFGAVTMQPEEYIVLAVNNIAADAFYGITTYDFAGSLSNSGEAIILYDNLDRIIDSVDYGTGGDWPSEANGVGASLTFCDPSMDNNNGLNWSASMNFIDTLNGFDVLATPGASCYFPDAYMLEILTVNNDVDPLVDEEFFVDVALKDSLGNTAELAADINFDVVVINGTGIISGSTTVTIPAGTSGSFTLTNLFYDTAEENLQIVINPQEEVLGDTSNLFNVLDYVPFPYELKINSVNNGNDALANVPFEVEISLLDSASAVTLADADLPVTLSLNSGTGTLGGTLSGTIAEGESSYLFTDITYDIEETGIIVSITDDNAVLLSDDSDPFNVVAPEYKLIISEVADPVDDTDGRFIEIFNAGSTIINFDVDTFYVSRQTNGGTTWENELLTGIIEPGEALVLANSGTGFESVYGFAPDFIFGGSSGNGDDAYFLYRDGDHTTGTLFDIYGEIDVDGTGMDWEYEDAHAVRKFDITDPNTTWTLSEWYILSGGIADMTPGYHVPSEPAVELDITLINNGNDVYVNVPFEIVVNTFDANGELAAVLEPIVFEISVSAGTGNISGTITGTIPFGSNQTTVTGLAYDVVENDITLMAADTAGLLNDGFGTFNVVEPPAIGNIVITEIMYNSPEGGTDSLEYLELYNASYDDYNLKNCYFSEGIDHVFGDIVLGANEYMVLAKNADACNNFYGVTFLEWNTGVLGATGEKITLMDSLGRVLDSVNYDDGGDWPSEAGGEGYSLEFCNIGMDNSDPANWMLPSTFIDTLNGFDVYGTPGTGCQIPTPYELRLTVNNGFDAVVNLPFDVKVEALDESGDPVSAIGDINVTLEQLNGTGMLAGTLTGTILSGSSSVTISGLTYDTEENNVSVAVSHDDAVLLADTAEFNVVLVDLTPAKIVITSLNGGSDIFVNQDFSVEIELQNTTGDVVSALSDITISLDLATGTGNFTSNGSVTIPAGDSTAIAYGSYDQPEQNIAVRAYDVDAVLVSDTSELFDVLYVPELNPGDIAFLQFRSHLDNGFTFVTLADIPGNTEVKFTTNGIENDQLGNDGQTMIWTAPAEGVAPKTVLTWQRGVGLDPQIGSVSGEISAMNLGADQIIIYVGSETAPGYVYGLSLNSWLDAGTIDATTSHLPSVLENANTAIYFTNINNAKYLETTYPGTLDALRLSISDTANWEAKTSSGYVFEESTYWGDPFFGFEEVQIESNISYYPNPVTDQLLIKTDGDFENGYVYNSVGEVVHIFDMKSTMTEVSFEKMSSGLYYISIIDSAGQSTTFKVVK